MGYRSSWALVVYSEDNEQVLADFEVWLELKAAEEKQHETERMWVFGYIKDEKINDLSHPEKKGFLTYNNDYTKCYDPWDDGINAIGKYCEEHGLEWDYVRVGEDLTDIERKGESNNTLVNIDISLSFT
jgi:hypothetical protein